MMDCLRCIYTPSRSSSGREVPEQQTAQKSNSDALPPAAAAAAAALALLLLYQAFIRAAVSVHSAAASAGLIAACLRIGRGGCPAPRG